MESWDMRENKTTEKIQAPSNLPKLFIAPSCLPKFSMILAAVADMKDELSKKTIEIEEASGKKLIKREDMEQLETQCFWLRSRINALESEAQKMRMELVKRVYVEVRSVKEMKAVNELRLGVGARSAPGMRCFCGKIYVPNSVPRDVIRAMAIVERSVSNVLN